MDVVDVNPETSLETSEGEGGGMRGADAVLSRTDMAVLARADNEFPISPDDRAVAVALVMNTMRTTKSKKIMLAAVRTLAVLDKANISRQKNKIIQDKPPELPKQVTINYHNLTPAERKTMLELALKAGTVDAEALPLDAGEAP
jgi:hypothetical protein